VKEPKSIFLVASRGLTATTWFSKALNRHGNICCTHGRDAPGREMESAELLQDDDYRKSRLTCEQWQRRATIDQFLATIDPEDSEWIVGNVHGYVLPELLDKMSASVHRGRIVIANMVRDPIAILESYMSLVIHNHRSYREKYLLEHLPRAEKNQPLLQAYGLGGDPSIEMQGFVEGCQMVNKMAQDLSHANVPVIRMEDLVSNKAFFVEVVNMLTIGRCVYPKSLLDEVFSVGPLNSHQIKIGRKQCDMSPGVAAKSRRIWSGWEPVKRTIFKDIVGLKGLEAFQAIGYDSPVLNERDQELSIRVKQTVT
jgi:hypothetical protein